MNKLEKLVYDLVKTNPKIKIRVRNIYQSTFDLLPRKKDFSINPIVVKEGFYFGFHDITPFSYDDNYILANKLTIPFRMPRAGDILEVGFFPFNKNIDTFTQIGSSRAWNYHKGCRLQWLGKNHIIYNDTQEKQLVSKIHNFKTGEETMIPHAIDSASPCGRFATSYSYERLEKFMPGYGYAFITDDSYLSEGTSVKTGIFLIDIATGEKKMIINLRDLAKLGPIDPSAPNHHHYVTHSLFSPDSRYISFIHCWAKPNDARKRWIRLITYDTLGKKFNVSTTDDMVSHYVWNNKNQLLAYARTNNIDSHVLFSSPSLKDYGRIAYPRLNFDGHQSFISDDSFITDTYPDKFRMAHLYKVEMDGDSAKLIASLNSPKKYQSIDGSHWACDLHPRMNHAGNFVCFDSVHTGTRALCFMKITTKKKRG